MSKYTYTMIVKKCTDIGCPHLKEEEVYPPDSFEMPYCTYTCTHPAVNRPNTSLGIDDEPPFAEIPDWCPRIGKDLKTT